MPGAGGSHATAGEGGDRDAGGTSGTGGRPERGRWIARRAAPLTASAVLVLLACAFVPLWNGLTGGTGGWHVPGDLWGTQRAAWELLHGHPGAVYSPATALVTLPGILVVLAPAVALAGALHWSVVHPGGAAVVAFPTGWLFIEVASIAASLPVLFVADAMAERLGAPRRRRFLLAALETVGLWNVVVWWGHPEDALAVALLLAGAGWWMDGRRRGGAWLLGAAVATQPVVVLGLPVLLARTRWRQLPGVALRLVLPTVVLVAAPLAANWHGTLRALVAQPNFPQVDHTTPWTSLAALAPATGHHTVASGPLRLIAVALAVALGLWAGRRRADPGHVLLVMAACFAIRIFTEPVMVGYYAWPVFALALVAAAGLGPWRLIPAGVVAVVGTVFGDATWRGNWSWWAIEAACAVAVLVLAVPGSRRAPGAPAPPGDAAGTDHAVAGTGSTAPAE